MTESRRSREVLGQGGLQARREVLHETARSLAAGGEVTLRLALNEEHPADLAELFSVLDEESGRRCLGRWRRGCPPG